MTALGRISARIAVTFFVAAITFIVLVFLFPQYVLIVDSGNVSADALIVLGGGNGRSARAAELYQQGASSRIIVTGAGDGLLNMEQLIKSGVPATAITQEGAAHTTFENAKFSVAILRRMNAHSAIIVTSWFHCRRALACFRSFAPDIKFYSRPTYLDFHANDPNREILSERVNSEYLKLIGYWVLHGVSPF